MQHLSMMLLCNICLRCYYATLVYDAIMQYLSTMLLCRTCVRCYYATLVYDVIMHHLSTMLLCNTCLRCYYATLVYDAIMQHLSTYIISSNYYLFPLSSIYRNKYLELHSHVNIKEKFNCSLYLSHQVGCKREIGMLFEGQKMGLEMEAA